MHLYIYKYMRKETIHTHTHKHFFSIEKCIHNGIITPINWGERCNIKKVKCFRNERKAGTHFI